ncbi:MAG: hypothetical protein ACXAC7_22935 [Candidatus Hodarchaeales archaeon]|jgi:hypothetical protein
MNEEEIRDINKIGNTIYLSSNKGNYHCEFTNADEKYSELIDAIVKGKSKIIINNFGDFKQT